MGEYMVVMALQLMISAALMAIGLIVSLFIGHIIFLESIALGVAGGLLTQGITGIHPALALLVGIIIFALLSCIQRTRFGFWIVGGVLSLVWGLLLGALAYGISGKDAMWAYVIWGLGTLVMVLLHLNEKRIDVE